MLKRTMKINLKKFFTYLTITGVIVFVAFFIITSIYIRKTVKERCLQAQACYSGDCVEVLIKTLEDEKNSFKKRNSAIWALGQIGDRKALSALQKYYTGKIPDKESFDKTISQYELQKAIKLCKGGFNATKIFGNN